MIQRIQSLYLLLVAGLTAALFFIPVSVYKIKLSGGETILINNLMNLSEASTHKVFLTLYPVSMLTFIISSISVFTIFLFKNRKLQALFSRIIFLLLSVLLVMLFFYIDFQLKCFTRENPFSTTYLIGAYFPFVSLFLTYLAIRGIRADEELVRSADRLRN